MRSFRVTLALGICIFATSCMSLSSASGVPIRSVGCPEAIGDLPDDVINSEQEAIVYFGIVMNYQKNYWDNGYKTRVSKDRGVWSVYVESDLFSTGSEVYGSGGIEVLIRSCDGRVIDVQYIN